MTVPKIFFVVTGRGEELAVPGLFSRIAESIDPNFYYALLPPYYCPEGSVLKPESQELERALTYGSYVVGEVGGILVLLDCEDDCPGALGPQLQRRCEQVVADLPVSVVCAYREFETWFLFSLDSLRGFNGLKSDIDPPEDPERIRGAKEWIARHRLTGTYSERIDQVAFSRRMDLGLAGRSDSFRKLVKETGRLIERIRLQTES